MALLAVSGLLVAGSLVTLVVCHLVAEVDRQNERASHRRLLAELHRHGTMKGNNRVAVLQELLPNAPGYPSVTDEP